MRKKVPPIFSVQWSPVLIVIEVCLLGIIFGIIFGNSIRIFYFVLLLNVVINVVKKKWRAFFKGTIHGKVAMKYNATTIIPLENIEISYSYPMAEPRTPAFTDAAGEFRFEREVPLGRDFTLTAKIEKIGKNRYVHQDIGEIEEVRWFLGRRWLGLPISSGIPKRVDFVVPFPYIDTNR